MKFDSLYRAMCMKQRIPSLNGLRAFEAAARHGRMSLAADALCVTHGAISRSVRHLEAELGSTLFFGPRSHIELTESGRRLSAEIAPAFRALEAAVAPYWDEEAGFIDVSCLGTFTVRWLIPRLLSFHKIAPQIGVRLTASDQPIDVHREQYEMAIRLDDHPIPDDVRVTKLFTEYVGLVGSPMILANMELKSARDLAGIPVLRTKTRIHAWERWTEHSGETDHSDFKDFDNSYFMLEAATVGLGVCVAPWPLVIQDILAGRLLAPFGFMSSGHHYVAARRDIRSRKVERFCEWLAVEASATPKPALC